MIWYAIAHNSTTAEDSGNMSEKLRFEQKDATKGYTILSLIGDLDMWTLPSAREQVNNLVEEGKVKLVLDLEKTDYIDSSGLGFFVATYKKMRDNKGDFLLINLNDYISGVFKLIELQNIINVYDSLEEASKNFK